MKRLGIFSFYDKEGIVDSYIEYLLGELMTVLDRVIVVVNGQVNENGRQIFSRYTNKLIIRKNKGFDGGAYADVIINVLGDSIGEWDELVLCNDTFFGPFVPMKSIFEKMERKQLDFWGLNISETKLLTFIHSYFLVFGTKILQNGELTQYFQDNINPQEDILAEIHWRFERGLFLNLAEKQYSYGTFCNTEQFCIFDSSDICLERYGFPILKKKAFSGNYSTQTAINAVRYVRNNTNYDINHILRCVQRLYDLQLSQDVLSEYVQPSLEERVHLDFRFSREELDVRIGERDFYIYGTGVYGYMLYYLHLYKSTGLKGFVVSDSEQIRKPFVCGLPVFHYSEIDKKSLVILAVRKKLTELIKPRLDKRTEYIELWE